ncbi:Cupin 2, conserved barrel domain protein (plasmid) [Novosphingobium aromaticivorans DSM 12444]|uniref:Cupin 2, conserved barrel domain protein n=1 Tax=Novosphingobium aromaticivorans (strain ATCC 700278 / DSM 12444 / CCUG 56034 / CIP 105152 / NBRC 16084 / F199) TaxID=279238 RepID=A4XEL7_NOVAD|nr:cupin domain-containing protein [Novosphingobium aromaticivorans]ABP64378.1 Cupin 2, conserved barrel domain protein [Novosphingobium aromaticivorans DSM 12444]SCY82350.1 Mannose-6-phosphate isomerase, cupin superfamily [Novosphingobium aromaticivorans]
MTAMLALFMAAAPPMAVIDEADTVRREPPPHGAIGMSTAWRISDFAPQPRRMEFRRRTLDPGAAIGEHPIAHDEVYYVLEGEGEVVSDGQRATLKPGMTAYLYEGAIVGIRQKGDRPLALIIAYPVKEAPVSSLAGRKGQ